MAFSKLSNHPAVNKIKEKVEKFKGILNHLGLYVGLILYTVIGAWIFILIEHPVEKASMDSTKELLVSKREGFLALVYNLTSQIDPNAFSQEVAKELYSPETIKTMILSTNKFRPSWQRQEFYSLEELVHRLDRALLEYEDVVAQAVGEGINVTTKQGTYKWTYVQSVFFTSTIVTTVGYGNIAPATTAGRLFCILFAIIGIPFTLSVIADVGQICATIVTILWARAKPVVMPIVDRCKKMVDRLKRDYRRRQMRGRRVRRAKKRRQSSRKRLTGPGEEGAASSEGDDGGDSEDDSDADSDDSDESDDGFGDISIGANIMMGLVALFSLSCFLGIGSYVFKQFETWTFFEAFYFCFITLTTIGFGDMTPTIDGPDAGSYMFLCMVYVLVGLSVTSTIIELVRRQYAESWQKMQELRAQIQAQLKLADHLRKMAQQGRDLEGMDVDLDELRKNLSKLKKGKFGAFLGDFDFQALDDWINNRQKVKAVTIFFYETSL